jgi:TetR/AcrR family transcriptional regulator, regulator of cefoperazone and chloramphenicol sensitivity
MPRARDTIDSHRGPATARRLIEAAGPVFAERGYRQATVREISSRARANLAAVNYHFGGKLGLYQATLRHIQDQSTQAYASGMPLTGPAHARLERWVAVFLHKILGQDRPQWQTRVMMREMVDPSPALDHLVEHSIRPQYLQLAGIVAELCDQSPDSALVRDCTVSIVGQCLIHRHCKASLSILLGCERSTPEDIDALATHIARFSLAALETIRRNAGRIGGRP